MIGSTLGSYRIVEQIGVGGMATVYKAYDPGTDRYVAVKVLPHQYSSDPAFVERFRREAKAIAKLEHPHILPVHAYDEDGGTAYLVMRYMDAGTLAERLQAGALNVAQASALLRQVGDALTYAHSQNILHRDVKPSNVLLDAQGNAYLMDFGIAKMMEGVPDLTGTGLALGTPQYMSPEQCMGVKELTPATDVYALGVVLYQMVTGQVPFQAETPLAVIHKQLNEPLPPPRSLRPDLPEGVEKVILKAMAKRPEERYQSCVDMADAMEKAVAAAPAVKAAPAPTPPPSTTPPEPVVSPIFDERPQRTGGLPGWVLAVGGGVLLLGCLVVLVAVVGLGMLGGGGAQGGGDVARSDSDSQGGGTVPLPEPTRTPVPTSTTGPTRESVPPSPQAGTGGGECDSRAAPMDLNRSYSGHIEATDAGYPANCTYYCLWVPDGTSQVTVSLTDFEVDLDIYLELGPLSDLIGAEPGEADYVSNEFGTDDERVVIAGPSSDEAYYIEVCSYEGLTSDFQIEATTP